MAEPLMIPMLLNKRQKLLAEITSHEDAIKAIWGQIAHVDGVLKLYGQDVPTGRVQDRVRRQGTIFGRGQLHRLVMDYARQCEHKPLPRETARHVIVRMGWDEKDRELFAYIHERVRQVMKKARKANCGERLSGGT